MSNELSGKNYRLKYIGGRKREGEKRGRESKKVGGEVRERFVHNQIG